MKVACSRDP